MLDEDKDGAEKSEHQFSGATTLILFFWLLRTGMVSEEEFLIFADPRVERQFAEADFRVADADGDGYLTSGEFQKSGHALELIEVHERICGRVH